MAIFEPQILAAGVAYKKVYTAITVKEIISSNFVRGKRLILVKNKSKLRKFWGWEVETQKTAMIYISFKKLLTKKVMLP